MAEETTVVVEEAPPLTKEEQARAIVRNYMLGNAAISLVPLPFVDLLALTGVQLKMMHSLANLYGVEFRSDLAKGLVFSLASSLGSLTVGAGIALSALKFIPGLFTPLSVLALPACSAALTYAVGRVFTLHFGMGGTLLDFDPKKMHEHFRKAYKEGLDVAATEAKSAPAAAAAKPPVAKAPAAEKAEK